MQTCRLTLLHGAQGKNLPEVQGLILGSTQRGKQLDALVDRDDVHCLMIGASGVGKTAFFLYPNLEFACASGMSYLALDTKGDLVKKLRHDCEKILRLPRFRDRPSQPDTLGREQPADAHQPLHGHRTGASGQPCGAGRKRKNTRRSSPKPSSIRAATIRIAGRMRSSTTPPRACSRRSFCCLPSTFRSTAQDHEKRHIVSVFKLVQELLAPSGTGQENRLSGLDGQPALDAQSQMVCGRGAQHFGTGHGVGHVHGAVPAERFPRFRAGAGALF